MNKGKQLVIALLCGFEKDHPLITEALTDVGAGQDLMQEMTITKADLFSVTSQSDSFFAYKETWDHFSELVELLKKNGESLTYDDLSRKIAQGKSAMDFAKDKGEMKKLLDPEIWKGAGEAFEGFWFSLSIADRAGHNFSDIRRKIAAAEGNKLREDELGEMGIEPEEMRAAIGSGELENVRQKLSMQGAKFSKDDLFLYNDDDHSPLDSSSAWAHFEKIHAALAEDGIVLDVEDYLRPIGNDMNLLKSACKHNRQEDLFSSEIWAGREQEMMTLYNALSPQEQSNFDINMVLFDITEKVYGAEFLARKDVSSDDLTAVLNEFEAPEEEDDCCPVRPLGLKCVWENIEAIQKKLEDKGETLTMEMLQVKSGYGQETGLMMAARYGAFDKVVSIFEKTGQRLTAEALLKKNKSGKSVLDELLSKEKHTQVLHPKMWIGNGADLKKVMDAIPSLKQSNIDFQSIFGDVHRLSLREKFLRRAVQGGGPDLDPPANSGGGEPSSGSPGPKTFGPY